MQPPSSAKAAAAPPVSPRPTARAHDQYFRTDDLREGVAGRAIRGGAFTVGSQGSQFIISLLSTMVMARLLTPRDYGLIGMVTVVTGFLTIFKDMGLSRATIQRHVLTHDEASSLFWINGAVGVCIALLTMAIAPVIARFYGEPRLTDITVALACGFLVSGFSVQHQALLRRRMRFGILAVNDVLSISLAAIVGIIMAREGLSYWAIVGFQLTFTFSAAILAWTVCRWRPSLPKRSTPVKEMLAFGGNITGFTVLNYFSRNTDDLLIGRFWGSQQLGLYAKAYQLLLFPLNQINLPIGGVAVPTLSRLVDEPERYRAAFARTLDKIEMLTMPLVVFLLVSSDWLIAVVLGPQWVGAAKIFMWLAIAGFVQPIGYTTGWLFTSQNRTGELLRWGIVSSAIAVGSIAAGVHWGAEGVAKSYGLSSAFLTTPLNLWFVGRRGPVRTRDFYRISAPFAISAIAAGGAVFLFHHFTHPAHELVGLIIGFCITAVVFLVGLAFSAAGRAALKDVVASLEHLRGRA
ncbi:MAG TPA: lipopolysaccharide biosynthesis protein [Gemmatimonadaceae bacterium]|nr:lipopolysaccharide biosynthesis protein [Gemmatimonadaceae bacterium]